MKTLVRILGLAFLTSLFLNASATGDVLKGTSYTNWGDFKISKTTESELFDAEKFETYVVNYENISSPVYVGIKHKRNCREYVIHVNGFEVQYTCNITGFGLKSNQVKYTESNPFITQALLNAHSVKNQQILTDGKGKSDEYLLELIACYLPQLMNNQG